MSDEHPFGEPEPGQAVKPRHGDPFKGYRPRGRWVRRGGDHKWVRLPDDPRERPESQDNTRNEYIPSNGGQVPSYKTVFGSFLKQEDLQGKTPRVVIASVDTEDVKDDSGKTERKLVAHFVGKDKGLILNRTNAETLEEITGTDDYGAWVGHAVVLWTDPTVKFGGKTVGGLRIRGVQAAAPPPPPPPPPSREVGADDGDEIPF